MSKLKITPGEWYLNELRNRVESEHKLVCTVLDGKGNAFNHLSQDIEVQEANATLIADAGTTYNQCRLLSSELLAARDKSEEDYDKLSNTAVQLKYENNELLQQNEELKEALAKMCDYHEKQASWDKGDNGYYTAKTILNKYTKQ